MSHMWGLFCSCVQLCREAEARGVSCDSLLFTEHVPFDMHIQVKARCGVALDTARYNSHGTAADMLWYLPIYLSIYLPTYLSTYLPIYLCIYLCIYLSTYVSIPPHLPRLYAFIHIICGGFSECIH